MQDSLLQFLCDKDNYRKWNMGDFTLYMDVGVSNLCPRKHHILAWNQEIKKHWAWIYTKILSNHKQKRYSEPNQTKCGKVRQWDEHWNHNCDLAGGVRTLHNEMVKIYIPYSGTVLCFYTNFRFPTYNQYFMHTYISISQLFASHSSENIEMSND